VVYDKNNNKSTKPLKRRSEVTTLTRQLSHSKLTH
jgi:hypothetical protein